MTDYSNSFEGGTAGSAITTINSGGTSGSAFSSTSTFTLYDATHPAHGSLGCKISGAGTSGALLAYALTASQTVAIRFYVYLSALPGNDLWISRQTAGGLSAAVIEINAAGKLALLDKTGVARWTATNTFPVGQMVRIEAYLDAGTSATTGSGKIAYYSLDSATAIEASSTLTGQNFGGANIDNVNFGKANGNDLSTTTIWLDDVIARTGAADFVGPVAASPPSGTTSLQDNVAVVSVVGSGGTAPYTYAIAPTTGTTQVSPGVWRIAKHPTDPLIYAVTVTDANAVSSTPISVTVPPYPAGSAWPRHPSGALPTSTWV